MTKNLTSSDSEQDGQSARDSNYTGGAPVTADWRRLLDHAIETEILPRLLKAPVHAAAGPAATPSALADARIVAEFVELIIADEVEQLREIANRVIEQTGGREALLSRLLAPAAQLLGVMWERDHCDFMTVTLGVYRLDQIMKETSMSGAELPLDHGFDHRVLLLPAPGEQHSLGLSMVADAFREGGWCVRAVPGASRAQLLRLVKDEWFDVIGISVMADRWLKGLPACIRAVRAASCNPGLFVMVGGQAISNDPERTRFLGADAVAADHGKALLKANIFMKTIVTERFRPFKTDQVDTGLAL